MGKSDLTWIPHVEKGELTGEHLAVGPLEIGLVRFLLKDTTGGPHLVGSSPVRRALQLCREQPWQIHS